MTKEERENSLHCLKVMVEEANCEDCKLYGTTGTDHCERDCVRNAIEALEQEPCEDVVSRQAVIDEIEFYQINPQHFDFVSLIDSVKDLPSVNPQKSGWIPVSERLPETDNKNSINSFNVLLWVKYKKYPEKKAQIYLGKLRRIDGDDGSGNFWGIKTETCEWTIWGWSYFYEPEVIAWMPLPEPFEPQESEDQE